MSKLINTGFYLNAPQPIDGRMRVETLAGLSAIPVKYNRMVTHVISENKDYRYYSESASWSELTYGGTTNWGGLTGDISTQTDLINKFSNYALTDHTHTDLPVSPHTHNTSDINSNLDNRVEFDRELLAPNYIIGGSSPAGSSTLGVTWTLAAGVNFTEIESDQTVTFGTGFSLNTVSKTISFEELDPTVPSHVKSITPLNLQNWNAAFSWGNHATSGYILQTQKGVPGGVASLDASGKVLSSQIPALAISETFPVTSEAEMLGLTQAEQGDVAIRSDISKSFILRTSPASVLANWSELLSSTDAVTSVNSQVGVVTLTTANVPDSTNKRYQTDAQNTNNNATSPIQGQLDGKANDADVIHKTGNETKTGRLTLRTPNIPAGTSNLNALAPIVVTGGNGGDNSSPSGFAVGGNSAAINIKSGNGGNSVTSAGSTNLGGNAGEIYIVSGDGGLAVNGTTNFPGNAGKVMLQGGDSYGGIAGAAYLKAGNNRGVNSLGGSVYIVPGYGDANIDLNGNPIYHGAVFLNSLDGSNVRGNTVIGGTIDDKTHRLQVTGNSIFNGTIKANPASLSNEVVTKSQLDLKEDSLGFTPENVVNKVTDIAVGANNTTYPTSLAVKTYADNLVAGMLNDRGSWDASVNLFPTTGGSGTAGAIRKGDMWYVSIAGTLGGKAVNVGDSFRALVNAPAQIASNWSVLEANIGYVPANDLDVVHKTGDETVAGIKSFSGQLRVGNGTLTNPSIAFYNENLSDTGFNHVNDGEIQFITDQIHVSTATTTGLKSIAFTKTGGTSFEFLKADGSIDSNTYALDDSTVKLTGSQTVQGEKTLTDKLTVTSVADISDIHNNLFIGKIAGNLSTTGGDNVGLGYASMLGNTTGQGNTAVGQGTLQTNTAGNYNTAAGISALSLLNGGDYNTAIGTHALFETTTGNRNTATGAGSSQKNTVGTFNTSNGWYSLYSNTTGVGNTGYGSYSLNNNVTGSGNIGLGYFAGSYELGSNKFYVNSIDRINTEGDVSKSLIYGEMDNNPQTQRLRINAEATVHGGDMIVRGKGGGFATNLYIGADDDRAFSAKISYNPDGNLYIVPRTGYSTIFPTGGFNIGSLSGTGTRIVVADSSGNLSTDSTVYAPLASPLLTGTPTAPTAAPGTNTTQIATTAFVLANAKQEVLSYALSDESSNLTVGDLITFRMPFAMTLASVRLSANIAPTVSSIIVNVKENGSSIFSTLLSIDATEKTSTTAATPAVISDTTLADDAEITVSTTQIGSGASGAGLKITFIGTRV